MLNPDVRKWHPNQVGSGPSDICTHLPLGGSKYLRDDTPPPPTQSDVFIF